MNSQWIQEQFSSVKMNDTRLQNRAVKIAQACSEHPEKSLPCRFADWAGVKASYRFFSNEKASHQTLQEPHYQNVLSAAKTSEELVLFIQDGSELLYNSHPWTHGLGPTADSAGNGLMFHSCLVAKYHESQETEILGLSYQEAWIRPEKKSLASPKESEVWLRTLRKSGSPQRNWVSVGDRGNDIYDFLHSANSDGWKFVVRARHDRKVVLNGESQRLFPWIRKQTAKGHSKLLVRAKGKEFSGEVDLEITWTQASLLPPGKDVASTEDRVSYIRVWCPKKPKLEWLLISNLPLRNEEEARKIIEVYRRRWLIEDYHKALKTGCRIEHNQLKQAHRILALFGMVGVIATQLLAMREHCRLSPSMPVDQAVPQLWIMLVEKRLKVKLETVRDFWRCLARMGGFLARKSDGEPGWQTIWGGYTALQDMVLGVNLMATCG
jgi:hypothetical protein